MRRLSEGLNQIPVLEEEAATCPSLGHGLSVGLRCLAAELSMARASRRARRQAFIGGTEPSWQGDEASGDEDDPTDEAYAKEASGEPKEPNELVEVASEYLAGVK